MKKMASAMTEAFPDISEEECRRLERECEAAGVLDLYFEMVQAGEFPRGAAMCALMQPPRTKNTDRTFCEGAHRAMEDMPPSQRNRILKIAKRAGVKTEGKFYKGGLGHYTDQAAWVSSADDVLAVAKARNLTITGAVNHQGTVMPPKRTKLAPDLVNEMVQKELKADGALRERIRKQPKKLSELKEKVVSTYGPRR